MWLPALHSPPGSPPTSRLLLCIPQQGSVPRVQSPLSCPPTRCRCRHSSGLWAKPNCSISRLRLPGGHGKPLPDAPWWGWDCKSTAEWYFPELGLPFPGPRARGVSPWLRKLLVLTSARSVQPVCQPGLGPALSLSLCIPLPTADTTSCLLLYPPRAWYSLGSTPDALEGEGQEDPPQLPRTIHPSRLPACPRHYSGVHGQDWKDGQAHP